MGHRQGRFQSDDLGRLSGQAIAVAAGVFLESPRLGSERQAFAMEPAGALDDGIDGIGRLVGAVGRRQAAFG